MNIPCELGRLRSRFILVIAFVLSIFADAHAAPFTIAAASDLTYALSVVFASYKNRNSDAAIAVVYGSSGKLCTQITQDAPFDLFMPADISYPRNKGVGAGEMCGGYRVGCTTVRVNLVRSGWRNWQCIRHHCCVT